MSKCHFPCKCKGSATSTCGSSGALGAMATLPRFDAAKNRIDNPHVVILGAGASIAACPNGDRNGRILPSLQNVQETVGLDDLIIEIEKQEGSLGDGFEAKYPKLVELGTYP